MSKEGVAAQIGKAWGAHREGRQAEAISEFMRIVKEAPDSVDAYYGLGLAQRSDGQNEAAINSFKTAYDLAKEAQGKFGVTSDVAQTQREDNLLRNVGYDDRYMMLRRMIRQRLAELGAPVPEE
jgi:tetratricopeptide (TPR) repeat protein